MNFGIGESVRVGPVGLTVMPYLGVGFEYSTVRERVCIGYGMLGGG